MPLANQQLLNPIPCVEWAYWIKVIKGERMHLRRSVTTKAYQGNSKWRELLTLFTSAFSKNVLKVWRMFHFCAIFPCTDNPPRKMLISSSQKSNCHPFPITELLVDGRPMSQSPHSWPTHIFFITPVNHIGVRVLRWQKDTLQRCMRTCWQRDKGD